jgi:hypothetical protein
MERDTFNLIKWPVCSLDMPLVYMKESSSMVQMHLMVLFYLVAGKGELRRLYSACGRRFHVASSTLGKFPSNRISESSNN